MFSTKAVVNISLSMALDRITVLSNFIVEAL